MVTRPTLRLKSRLIALGFKEQMAVTCRDIEIDLSLHAQCQRAQMLSVPSGLLLVKHVIHSVQLSLAKASKLWHLKHPLVSSIVRTSFAQLSYTHWPLTASMQGLPIMTLASTATRRARFHCPVAPVSCMTFKLAPLGRHHPVLLPVLDPAENP